MATITFEIPDETLLADLKLFFDGNCSRKAREDVTVEEMTAVMQVIAPWYMANLIAVFDTVEEHYPSLLDSVLSQPD